MTEDSQSRMRGYGPFHEGAEPTGPLAVPNAAQPAATPPVPAPTQPAPTATQPAATQAAPAVTHPASGIPAQPHSLQPQPDGIPAQPHGIQAQPHGIQAPIPHSGVPTSAIPTSAGIPTSPGYPVSAQPQYGAPYGFSGDDPTSAAPFSAQPASGGPAHHPTSGAYGPFNSAPGPTSGAGSPDPLDFTSPAPFAGRRIEPSPPKQRSRFLVGLIAGLVAGVLVFGTGGWFVGHRSAKGSPDAKPTTAQPSATPSLGVFEQNLQALNQPHFSAAPTLDTISQGWTPYMSSCARSGESGGPDLNQGEKTRVRCSLSGASVIFIEYNSIADRDKTRTKVLSQNVDARTLTPGVGNDQDRASPSGRTNGHYVEYAYKLTERGVTRTVSAIWWDDAQSPVAGLLLAYWKEGVGSSWDPMRDLWSRYA